MPCYVHFVKEVEAATIEEAEREFENGGGDLVETNVGDGISFLDNGECSLVKQVENTGA